MVKLVIITGFLLVAGIVFKGNIIHIVGIDMNILDTLSQKMVDVLQWLIYFGDAFFIQGQAKLWVVAMLVTVIFYIQYKIFKFIFSPIFNS